MEAFGHHGVKGMKWGVRKKDYTSSGSSSKQEAKTQKREAKAQKYEIQAAKGEVRLKEIQRELNRIPQKGFANAIYRNDVTSQRNQQATYVRNLQKNAERAREGKLTSNQKALIFGGVAVGGLLLVVGASSMQESGQLNSLKLRGQAALQGKEFSFKKNELFAAKGKSPDWVLKNVASDINPNYANPGGVMNCRRNSMAYELRRRGFDVQATPSLRGTGQSESGLLNALTPGERNKIGVTSLSQNVVSGAGIRAKLSGDSRVNPADVFSHKNKEAISDPDVHSAFHKSIIDSLSKHPEGARGEIVFDFGQFGHSMSWEIFKGKPVIFDTQKAQKYEITTPFEFHQISQKWGPMRAAEGTRLDNMEIDQKFLSRWATNSKGK